VQDLQCGAVRSCCREGWDGVSGRCSGGRTLESGDGKTYVHGSVKQPRRPLMRCVADEVQGATAFDPARIEAPRVEPRLGDRRAAWLAPAAGGEAWILGVPEKYQADRIRGL